MNEHTPPVIRPKKHIGIRIDADLYDYYKSIENDTGQRFTTAVEWALRRYMLENLTLTQRE